MGNEDTLISKLIEETYTGPTNKDGPDSNNVVDLRKYFEKRLNQVEFISVNDYLDQHHLSHHLLVFGPSGCFRLMFKEYILDFPANWSIFADIKRADFLHLDQSNDHDFLLDIFSELCGSYQNIILIKEHLEIQLVFLPTEESYDHVQWIRNYFEKKNIRSSRSEEDMQLEGADAPQAA